MEEYKITWREVLFSTVIISIMVGIGVWISNPIIKTSTETAIDILSAVKVKDAEKFAYIARTDVGEFYAEGKMVAIDPVSIPDIKGKYMRIKKIKQEYTRHTRLVSYTDSKGNTHTRIEVYYTWDDVETNDYKSNRVKFLNKEFNLNDINYRVSVDYNTTIKNSFFSDTRYVYYTHPTYANGVMNGICVNKGYSKLNFLKGSTIEKITESAYDMMNISVVGFWIVWIFLICLITFVFYAFENKWLED